MMAEKKKLDNRIEIAEGVSLSRICAGCMRLGGMKSEELRIFVERCLELGVDTFDHAPVYGSHTVEAFFGESLLLNNSSMRAKIKLVTKTGIILRKPGSNNAKHYNSSAANIRAELEQSLQKLKTDRIDLLLIHRPDPLMNIEETGAVLDDLVKSGKVLSVGVSNFSVSGFSALQSRMQTPLAVNQVELSIKSTENIFNGLMDNALERDLPLMAWSPLGGGSVFSCQNEQLCSAIKNIADELGLAPDTLLYAWLLRLPAKVIPITGTSKIERIQAAVKALDITLSYDHWYHILAASRGFDVP